MRARLIALLSVLILAVGISTSPAQASTGGTPDGNTHPNVGLILFYDGTGRFRCSATLVSPTVLLTAAHCTDGTVGKTLVTFDSVDRRAAADALPGRGESERRLHRG